MASITTPTPSISPYSHLGRGIQLGRLLGGRLGRRLLVAGFLLGLLGDGGLILARHLTRAHGLVGTAAGGKRPVKNGETHI